MLDKALQLNSVITTDDVCPSNLRYWEHWLDIKSAYPDIKVTAFVIANHRFVEHVSRSTLFTDWYEENKDWVTVGVHGYDHMLPQEGWREDQEAWIEAALNILNPFLPDRYLYRPPGFRFLAKTESILRRFGFAGIAHQEVIKYFDGGFEVPYNTHCCDRYERPVTEWRSWR